MSTTLDVNNPDALGDVVKDRSDAALLALAEATPGGLDGVLDALMERMRASFRPEAAGQARAVLRYDLKTPGGTRSYELHMADGECRVVQADDAYARLALTMPAVDFIRMCCGQLNLFGAYMKRRVKVKGDLKFINKVGPWFSMLDRYTRAG